MRRSPPDAGVAPIGPLPSRTSGKFRLRSFSAKRRRTVSRERLLWAHLSRMPEQNADLPGRISKAGPKHASRHRSWSPAGPSTTAAAEVAGERRHVTVMFCDLVDFNGHFREARCRGVAGPCGCLSRCRFGGCDGNTRLLSYGTFRPAHPCGGKQTIVTNVPICALLQERQKDTGGRSRPSLRVKAPASLRTDRG